MDIRASATDPFRGLAISARDEQLCIKDGHRRKDKIPRREERFALYIERGDSGFSYSPGV